jgi:hypothetical protein
MVVKNLLLFCANGASLSVMANGSLRNGDVYIPPNGLCTDNQWRTDYCGKRAILHVMETSSDWLYWNQICHTSRDGFYESGGASTFVWSVPVTSLRKP